MDKVLLHSSSTESISYWSVAYYVAEAQQRETTLENPQSFDFALLSDSKPLSPIFLSFIFILVAVVRIMIPTL